MILSPTFWHWIAYNNHSIAYSLSNICAKNWRNWLMCVEVIVCNVSVVFFLRHSVGADTVRTVLISKIRLGPIWSTVDRMWFRISAKICSKSTQSLLRVLFFIAITPFLGHIARSSSSARCELFLRVSRCSWVCVLVTCVSRTEWAELILWQYCLGYDNYNLLSRDTAYL